MYNFICVKIFLVLDKLQLEPIRSGVHLAASLQSSEAGQRRNEKTSG